MPKVTQELKGGLPPRVLGQAYTLEYDRLDRSTKVIKTTSAMNTIKKIAAKYGSVKDARAIADFNGIHSIVQKLKTNRSVKLPGTVIHHTQVRLDVLAGDQGPHVTSGYAKWEVVNRWGRAGAMQFDGYAPVTIEIPIRFESTGFGDSGVRTSVESDIETLEQMGGRGRFPGASTGMPGPIKITCTNSKGDPVPLLAAIHQSGGYSNPHPPKWVLTDISWGTSVPDEVFRNRYGARIRQTAVITVQQYVQLRPI